MTFNPKAGERIPVEKMRAMTKRYNTVKARGGWDTQSVYYGRETFERLMSVPGAVGVRVYFGLNEAGDELHPIFVPVDEKGNNIYESEGKSSIEEVGAPCPPVCPTGDDTL
jgi:hypothetical protein